MNTPLKEDRIKHLEMLQTNISRMASSSAMIKNLCMIIIAGALAFLSSNPNPDIPHFASVLTIIFWMLDAKYLQQEKWFRDMYDQEREKDPVKPATFVMTPSAEIRNKTTIRYGIQSWSTGVPYLSLVVFLLFLWFVHYT